MMKRFIGKCLIYRGINRGLSTRVAQYMKQIIQTRNKTLEKKTQVVTWDKIYHRLISSSKMPSLSQKDWLRRSSLIGHIEINAEGKGRNCGHFIVFISSVIAGVIEGSNRRSCWIQQSGPQWDWWETGRALLAAHPVERGDRTGRRNGSFLSIGSVSSSASLRWGFHVHKPQPAKQNDPVTQMKKQVAKGMAISVFYPVYHVSLSSSRGHELRLNCVPNLEPNNVEWKRIPSMAFLNQQMLSTRKSS